MNSSINCKIYGPKKTFARAIHFLELLPVSLSDLLLFSYELVAFSPMQMNFEVFGRMLASVG